MSAAAIDAQSVSEPVLAASGLCKAFGDRPVLADLDFCAARGAATVLFGASGAGKSLLLRLLLGLDRADAGSTALHARAGVVLERDALFEDRSVGDNVALALRAAPRRPAAAARRAVRESLLLVGLKHVEHLRPRALQPGTRRRVALARAIAHGPELLLVDEPAAGLDPVAAAAIHELIAQLRERLDLSVLVATRDPVRALAFADHAAFLHGGRIAAEGSPEALRARGEPDDQRATRDDQRAARAALQQLLAGRVHGPLS